MSVATGDYSAVLELVDLRRWGMRARIFALVARLSAEQPELGAYVGQRDVAESVRTGRRYAHALLHHLAREKVLKLVEPGAGRRPNRWRINPNLRAWRGVPWLVTPEHAAFRVSAAGAPSHVPKQPVATRSYGASQRGLATRSYGASQGFRSYAPYSASQDIRSDATSDRVASDFEPERDTSSLLSASHSARDRDSSSGDVQAVVVAITERTGCDVYGRLEDKVAALVHQHGPGPLLDEVAEIDPTGMRSPAFVLALERRMRQAGQNAETRRATLEARLVGVDKLIATYEAEGFPTGDLVAERAALAVQLGAAPPAPPAPHASPEPARPQPPDLAEEAAFLDVDPDELGERLAAAGHSRTVIRNVVWWLEGKGRREMRCSAASQRTYRRILADLGDL